MRERIWLLEKELCIKGVSADLTPKSVFVRNILPNDVRRDDGEIVTKGFETLRAELEQQGKGNMVLTQEKGNIPFTTRTRRELSAVRGKI